MEGQVLYRQCLRFVLKLTYKLRKEFFQEMKKKIVLASLLFASVLTLTACGSSSTKETAKETTTEAAKVEKKAELKDGTYKAETGFDDRGWKAVHTITVSGGKVTESTFDYENKEGALKSEDAEYNKNMEAKSGVSSKDATDKLDEEFLKAQSADVEVVTGATHTTENFKATAAALLEAAAEGNTETIVLK